MSFFRHEEIYRPARKRLMNGKPIEVGSPDHRLGESPTESFESFTEPTRVKADSDSLYRFWRSQSAPRAL